MHPGPISNVSCLQGPSFSLTFVKLDGAKIVAVKNNKSLSHLGLKTVVTFVSEVGRLFSLFAKKKKAGGRAKTDGSRRKDLFLNHRTRRFKVTCQQS